MNLTEFKTKRDPANLYGPPQALTRIAKFALAFWGILLVAGTISLAAYSNRPGIDGATISNWPDETDMVLRDDSLTLVLFLHPKCPCSVATVRELERTLGSNFKSVDLQIGLYCPPSKPDDWTETSLKKLAERIAPGATFVDRSAEEADRFGVSTSGHLLAFSTSGKCLFSGGVTGSRGHEGENRGSLELRKITHGEQRPFFKQPVFGCPLLGSTQNNDCEVE